MTKLLEMALTKAAQLADVEQEINGLLTYDRKPKFDPKDIKALNDLLR